MFDPLEAAMATAACSPPAEARAARLAKFAREQLIVDYLNRGVSIAEIAARVGIGEKRMRAVIREILAHRCPHPPEEFVAIQVSRLDEALLIAYSAMSPTNLNAVDQVVKIVRELDRYGGAFAAEWRRPEPSPRIIPGSQPGNPGLDAPADGTMAFGAALFSSAELALQDDEAVAANFARGERPENPAQHLEKVESAPGISTLVAALAERGDAVDDRVYKPVGARERPGIQPQDPENIESAPEFVPLSPLQRGEGWDEGLRRHPNAGSDPHPDLFPLIRGSSPRKEKGDLPAADNRSEDPAQRLENMESAPGNRWPDEAESGSLPNPLVPYPIGPGRLRMTLNGVLKRRPVVNRLFGFDRAGAQRLKAPLRAPTIWTP